MADVHATAVLEGDVTLADDAVVGPHCVLRGPVRVGPGTKLIGSVWLQGPITMGAGNTVYPFACLGFAPQHTAFDSGQAGPGVVVGDGNTFRESVSIHRAFTEAGPTTIGDRNYFMGNSHAGHDTVVGNDCIITQGAVIGGHAVVEDRVVMGGLSSVHQHVRLGRGAMLTGNMPTSFDIPPWFMLTGANICGNINLVGLRRAGFDHAAIDDVRWVYRVLYREGLTIPKALEALRERADRPLVAEYVRFIESSKRGVCPAVGRARRGDAVAETVRSDKPDVMTSGAQQRT